LLLKGLLSLYFYIGFEEGQLPQLREVRKVLFEASPLKTLRLLSFEARVHLSSFVAVRRLAYFLFVNANRFIGRKFIADAQFWVRGRGLALQLQVWRRAVLKLLSRNASFFLASARAFNYHVWSNLLDAAPTCGELTILHATTAALSKRK
jgi:hypothetical protein